MDDGIGQAEGVGDAGDGLVIGGHEVRVIRDEHAIQSGESFADFTRRHELKQLQAGT